MFRRIPKAGPDFQDAMFHYMADFIFYEMVPDTYDYTKLFGLWKGKDSKLHLKIMCYIHGKDWDAKLLEPLVTERMKPFILKYCPTMQIGGIQNNSSSENLIVVKNMDEIKRTEQHNMYIPSI